MNAMTYTAFELAGFAGLIAIGRWGLRRWALTEIAKAKAILIEAERGIWRAEKANAKMRRLIARSRAGEDCDLELLQTLAEKQQAVEGADQAIAQTNARAESRKLLARRERV